MKQKLICVGLSVILLLAPLTGCKKDVKTQPTKDPLGGLTKTLDFNNREFTAFLRTEDATDSDRLTARVKETEKKYHCSITLVDPDSEDFQKHLLESAMAGKPIGDFGYIYPNYAFRHSVGTDGAYLPLNQFSDILMPQNPNLWNVEADRNLFTANDVMLALAPRAAGVKMAADGLMMFFHKDILQSEGLWDKYNLYQMQSQKTWTWQVLGNMSRLVTKDLDGDGTKDRYGASYSDTFLRGIGHTNVKTEGHGGWTSINSDSTANIIIADSEHMPALTFMIKMVKEGGMYVPDYNTDYESDALQMFQNNTTVFYVAKGSYLSEAQSPGTLGAVALPLSVTGRKEYVLPMDTFYPNVICRGVIRPQEAAYLMRELVPPVESSTEEEQALSESFFADAGDVDTDLKNTFYMLSDTSRISTDPDAVLMTLLDPTMGQLYKVMLNFALVGKDENGTMFVGYSNAMGKVITKAWVKLMESGKKITPSPSPKPTENVY